MIYRVVFRNRAKSKNLQFEIGIVKEVRLLGTNTGSAVSRVWEYEIADGREEDFLDTLAKSKAVARCEAVSQTIDSHTHYSRFATQ